MVLGAHLLSLSYALYYLHFVFLFAGFLGQANTLGGGGVGGSSYPDLGKLVRAMTEKPVFDIPIIGSKTAGSTGDYFSVFMFLLHILNQSLLL